MLRIWGKKRSGRCDGVTRRDFVQVGTLGLSGLTLADSLRLDASAATASDPARAKARSRAKAVIVYWLDGGPTHFETYDPKPEAPAEYRGPMDAISTNVSGIQLSEYMRGHARHMDKVSVLRSMHHNNGDHYAAAHWMLTGYFGSNAASQAPQFPSAGSIVSRMTGSNQPHLPAYVAVPYSMTVGRRPGYNSGAYLGPTYNPFEPGGDPNRPGFKVRNLDLPAELTVERLGDRRALLGGLDRLRHEIDHSGLMRGVDNFNAEALEMVTGQAARNAFDIEAEDPRLRDRYGRNVYGQSTLLARRLVESGVKFVTIHNGGWDHHGNIENAVKSRVPTMDQSIAALIEDLDERGMMDDVIICVMGEFGRTPRVNGGAGRDHWGNVMSVLLGGGGLAGGQIVGASTAKGEYPAEQPLKPADVLATIYHALGIDLDASFVNHAGRPIPINNYGEVIRQLV